MTTTFEFANERCYGSVSSSYTHHDVELHVTFKDIIDGGKVYYIAPSPADHRHSFSGSGLPFPSERVAFEGTPNKGVLEGGASHTVKLFMPNAYYADFNGTLVPPYVLFEYASGGKHRTAKVTLGQGIPYRSLTYPKGRKDAMFYKKGWSLPVRTQEQIARHSGYPVINMEAPDYWGLRPPHP